MEREKYISHNERARQLADQLARDGHPEHCECLTCRIQRAGGTEALRVQQAAMDERPMGVDHE